MHKFVRITLSLNKQPIKCSKSQENTKIRLEEDG